MPESRKRKKPAPKTRPGHEPTPPPEPQSSPSWWAPTMVTLMVVGLFWIVITYLTKFQFPIPALAPLANGNGNLLAGFALVIAGFLMTLRWR